MTGLVGRLICATRVVIPSRDSQDSLPGLKFSAQDYLGILPNEPEPDADGYVNMVPSHFAGRRSQPANGTITDTISVCVEILRLCNNNSPRLSFRNLCV